MSDAGVSEALPDGWVELLLDDKPLWRHTSGVQVYQSSQWAQFEAERKLHEPTSEEIPTWKAQRVSDVPNFDDDGYLYMTRDEAMVAALAAKPDCAVCSDTGEVEGGLPCMNCTDGGYTR